MQPYRTICFLLIQKIGHYYSRQTTGFPHFAVHFKAALANCKQGAFRQGGFERHAAKPNNLFSTAKTDQL